MNSPRSLPRELLHLAWPVLISQTAVMANGVVDTLMAGQISALDLAGVGIGASIYSTVFVTLMGVLLALTPTVAHHYGAGRFTEIGADVRQSAWLALALSVVAVVLLRNPELFLMLARPAPEVEIKVRAYLDGMSWTVPAILLFRVYYGFTTGIGRPRPVMLFNLFALALKVPLNWLFMFGHLGLPAMGGAGAAWSSAVATWCFTVVAWLWCWRHGEYARYAVFARFDWPQWSSLRGLLALGLPTGATFLIDVTAFTFMALFVARLGAETSAAHQVAASVAVFVFMIPMALGHATGILVGQSLGAGNRQRARHAALLGMAAGVGIGLLVASVIGFGAAGLAALYSPDPGVRSIAASLLVIVAFYHLGDAVQAVGAQVLRGYKRATAPMMIYAVALWGVGLGGGYVLGLTDLLGAPRGAAGFWIAAATSLALAGVALLGYFQRISGGAEQTQKT
jgi:MATE family multidrug resistance protein